MRSLPMIGGDGRVVRPRQEGPHAAVVYPCGRRGSSRPPTEDPEPIGARSGEPVQPRRAYMATSAGLLQDPTGPWPPRQARRAVFTHLADATLRKPQASARNGQTVFNPCSTHTGTQVPFDACSPWIASGEGTFYEPQFVRHLLTGGTEVIRIGDVLGECAQSKFVGAGTGYMCFNLGANLLDGA